MSNNERRGLAYTSGGHHNSLKCSLPDCQRPGLLAVFIFLLFQHNAIKTTMMFLFSHGQSKDSPAGTVSGFPLAA